VARHLKERRFQRALLQFFKPENYFAVRTVLLRAKRQDLIGDGCDCLIPSKPPRTALDARRRRANRDLVESSSGKALRPAHPSGSAKPRPDTAETAGYRPHRRTARKRDDRQAQATEAPRKRSAAKEHHHSQETSKRRGRSPNAAEKPDRRRETSKEQDRGRLRRSKHTRRSKTPKKRS